MNDIENIDLQSFPTDKTSKVGEDTDFGNKLRTPTLATKSTFFRNFTVEMKLKFLPLK